VVRYASRVNLQGKTAVVMGASRGAGRGIARALGAAGATVYAAGRTGRGGPAPTDGASGTVEDTAEEVTARGGVGIAVRCDATSPAGVEQLARRVREERGRLDILVNAVWGGNERIDGSDGGWEGVPWSAPFWLHGLGRWDEMMGAGVWATFLASRAFAPLLVPAAGLVVHITDGVDGKYRGNFYWDVAHEALNRMTLGMAEDLRPHRVTCVGITPGFMRTERVLHHFRATEATWREVTGLTRSESPEYVGRAVAALASDEERLVHSGQLFHAADLATRYGFTDVDGRLIPRFEPA
jgi:NAD(P)-dependent dehydrogenase (short-subunit alcohol dehydrogenase family)